MLEKDPAKRWSAEKLLQHDFVKKYTEKPDTAVAEPQAITSINEFLKA